MCGRFTLTTVEGLVSLFEIDEKPRLQPRYNIAPTQDVATVRLGPHQRRQLQMMHWGLIPSWSQEAAMSARTINARSETVDRKPAFREAFRQRRCLIPADGFYEWKEERGRSLPFHFRLRHGELFAFAGLWEHWRDSRGGSVDSCTILTSPANNVVAPIHNRMPVILEPDAFSTWLDQDRPPADLKSLLVPFPAERMVASAVSRLVNSPHHDSAACLQPPEEAEPKPPWLPGLRPR